ncbi:hypothetical protein [Methanotorris igneus]|uniref:hypothetical protein n=1 Tax=Methanotorris igneus TaxID=2189 RepID=UPI00373AE628
MEKGMVANAFELMREWIVNAVILLVGEDEWLKREVRNEAEKTLEWFAPSSKNKKQNKELKETKYLPSVKENEVMDDLGKLWDEVREMRNTIAHAGMKKERPNVETVQRKASEILKKIEKIMENISIQQ